MGDHRYDYDGQAEEVTTIFCANFPADATHRELDNLCRFLPGFLRCKASFGRGVTLFALFDSVPAAQAAIDVLNDQAFDRSRPQQDALRVVMAKSNMRGSEPDRGGWQSQGKVQEPSWTPKATPQRPSYSAPRGAVGGHADTRYQATPARGGYWKEASYDSAPMKRAAPKGGNVIGGSYDQWSAPPPPKRRQAPSEGVDTVASVGAADAGFDEESLHNFYAQQQGFVAFKANSKLRGGFAKFQSPELAQQAVEVATAEGIPAAMARTSMQSS